MHPHIQYVVRAGGLAADHQRWIHPKYSFVASVNVLSSVIRAKFVDGLRKAFRDGKLVFSGSLAQLANPKRFAASGNSLFQQQWVVYAKPAFGAPSLVLRYLGRYTHPVAISNHRLLAVDGQRVTFRQKDYAHGNNHRKVALPSDGVSAPLSPACQVCYRVRPCRQREKCNCNETETHRVVLPIGSDAPTPPKVAWLVRIQAGHPSELHREERFKLSNDPQFEEKVRGIVGLYLNPPNRVVGASRKR